MKISTRGRYGVKALSELARRYGEGPISLKEIAETQDLSRGYLEQLLSSLREANLVESVRGAQGGYKLVNPPEEVSVGDILRVLEGPLAPVDCASPNRPDSDVCEKIDDCSTHDIWVKVRLSVEEVVDSISLSDLLEGHDESLS